MIRKKHNYFTCATQSRVNRHAPILREPSALPNDQLIDTERSDSGNAFRIRLTFVVLIRHDSPQGVLCHKDFITADW